MGRLITVEEIPQFAGGELRLDSVALGMPEFRLRVFRYAPSDIAIPAAENFLIVNYREGSTSMNRRVGGPWKQEHVGRGVTTLLTRAEPSNWIWRHVSRFLISTYRRRSWRRQRPKRSTATHVISNCTISCAPRIRF